MVLLGTLYGEHLLAHPPSDADCLLQAKPSVSLRPGQAPTRRIQRRQEQVWYQRACKVKPTEVTNPAAVGSTPISQDTKESDG